MAHFTGELDRVRLCVFDEATARHSHQRLWLISNGFLAFFLNVVSFNANRRVGPLAMNVACKFDILKYVAIELMLYSKCETSVDDSLCGCDV